METMERTYEGGMREIEIPNPYTMETTVRDDYSSKVERKDKHWMTRDYEA